MGTRTAAWLLPLLALCVAAGCKSAETAPMSGAPVPILRHAGGDDPALREPQVLLINSQEQLDELGSSQLAGLGVDFANESLVIVALGEQTTGGYWTRVTGIERAGDRLIVRGMANRPADDAVATQAMSYPYDAAVIPAAGDAMVHSQIESVVGQDPAADTGDDAEPTAAPVGTGGDAGNG